MEYYFAAAKDIGEKELFIKGGELKHLVRVLRKSKEDEIFVTDGKRNVYRAIIDDIGKDKIKCRILERSYNKGEFPLKIGLFQSLLKNPDRFELVIEKATELGVSEIYPVVSENVVNKKTDRHQRWQDIALNAMKQTQRCYLPEVMCPLSLEQAIEKSSGYETKLVAHERTDSASVNILEAVPDVKKKNSACVFIGPEGGFTDSELRKCKENSFTVITLGERKLRSETASLLIMSALFL